MTIYVVFKEGVYRHECFGAFTEQSKAEEIALDCIKAEVDDYHSFDVRALEADKRVDDATLICSFTRKDSKNRFGQRTPDRVDRVEVFKQVSHDTKPLKVWEKM